MWSQGMTSRPVCGPQCNWMPAPGPVAYHVQFVSFTSAVISHGLDQERPSSLELLTYTRRVSLLVWLIIRDSWSSPRFHVLRSHMSRVSASRTTQGLPQAFVLSSQ